MADEATVERRDLEARLRRPDRGENGFRDGVEPMGRLDALRRLKELADRGAIPRPAVLGGVNTHIHTAKSFSYFASPAQAVWEASCAGVAVLGINDHYTLAGHAEFLAAARIAGIRALLSLEAVAMWEEAESQGKTVNDPDNPGRTYLSAKAVTRSFAPGARGALDLESMNRALHERNREMTHRLAAVIEERLGAGGALGFKDVLALTPHGQPTERHIAAAAAGWLARRFPETAARAAAIARLCGEPPDGWQIDAARLEGFLRARLLKAGRPAYVPESRAAFVPVARLVGLALDLGAVPAYPVLGDPVTPWEADLDDLLDRLEALGIHALEVIPDRNRRERLAEIVAKAAGRGLPITSGTEHNTRSPQPLVDRWFFDPELRPHFELGARVLLGHQALRAAGREGYVREDGSLPPGDRRAHLERVAAAGGGF